MNYPFDPTEKMFRFLTGKGSNERTRKEKAIKFPVKLMYALQCGDYQDIITWTPSGLAFVILNPVSCERVVLPEIFKEAKFSSFQRKLKRWGFEKSKFNNIGTYSSCYCHPEFIKGDFLRCMNMSYFNQQIPKTTEPTEPTTSVLPALADTNVASSSAPALLSDSTRSAHTGIPSTQHNASFFSSMNNSGGFSPTRLADRRGGRNVISASNTGIPSTQHNASFSPSMNNSGGFSPALLADRRGGRNVISASDTGIPSTQHNASFSPSMNNSGGFSPALLADRRGGRNVISASDSIHVGDWGHTQQSHSLPGNAHQLSQQDRRVQSLPMLSQLRGSAFDQGLMVQHTNEQPPHQMRLGNDLELLARRIDDNFQLEQQLLLQRRQRQELQHRIQQNNHQRILQHNTVDSSVESRHLLLRQFLHANVPAGEREQQQQAEEIFARNESLARMNDAAEPGWRHPSMF